MLNQNSISNRENVPAPNYGKISFKEKFTRRLRNEFAEFIENTFLQFKIYPAYWHYFFRKNKSKVGLHASNEHFYLTQKPDYGAGIGHQLANWNCGFYFSQYFGIKFAHTPFSSPKWEELLGWGEGEILAKDLIDSSAYSKVRLPRFDSSDYRQIELIRSIMESYNGRKVLFCFEINQGYMRQCDTASLLSNKFFRSKSRVNDHLIFEENSYNIAVHIRRVESGEPWKDRELENSYYLEVMKSVLKVLRVDKTINIYLFSQGNEEEFSEFKSFKNMNICLYMNPFDSFLHMVFADLLIGSKSSFSYKPALISKGIKICPKTFWHSYPSSLDFILADNDGKFDIECLKILRH